MVKKEELRRPVLEMAERFLKAKHCFTERVLSSGTSLVTLETLSKDFALDLGLGEHELSIEPREDAGGVYRVVLHAFDTPASHHLARAIVAVPELNQGLITINAE